MIRTSGLAASAASSSSSRSDDLNLTEKEESFCSCGNHNDDFFRVNMGISTLTKNEMGAIMMGRLQSILQKYRSYRNIATGMTKDFYNYQILLIEKTLSNK
jgi:hypothetical protein